MGITLEEVKQQEAALHFTSFTQADAVALGRQMLAMADAEDAPIAIEVEYLSQVVFSCYPPGTNTFNALWMEKKRETAKLTGCSTYHQMLAQEAAGGPMDRGDVEPEHRIVKCGGGFPIIVDGMGVVGAIAASGPSNEREHMFAVEALSTYLEKQK